MVCKSSLYSISPLDGRYKDQLNEVRSIFSEYAFLKNKLFVEVSWIKNLLNINKILNINYSKKEVFSFLNDIVINFNEADACEIKKIENVIKHDVKAVEYFLRNKLLKNQYFCHIIEYVHFGCTSEDINNISYGLMINEVKKNIFLSFWIKIAKFIKNLSFKYKDISILCRTHGQPATPSTLGKEFFIFYMRIKKQIYQLKKINILAKFNGTTGNYNAHYFAHPEVNWIKISRRFVTSLGLEWNPYTAQNEPHDYIAELFHCIIRFNNILLDLNRDLWMYISFGYFKQKLIDQEVGSSIMPHKINPINFENSEGNIGLANSLMVYMSEKLPISRLQRDLSDSTVLRNIGVAVGYSVLAYSSFLLGLNRITINIKNIDKDLNNNWSILAEPIQTIMKAHRIKNSYEKLKTMTRGKKINKDIIHNFIKNLNLPHDIKMKLLNLTPKNYIGKSSILVENI
ncbi:adenylosuccinate lyase [Buchnera aphidicola]|uniref:Adenylosuccinate lyase n=1 Tax=Buchnera aphidicola (Anoecia oenotherae) TaxID=1241833 RepID=A0A4D6XRC9_9GAMM|nr:adenylosuccinate lyase [Buchnera aphidicola]QCI19336.1 adenylosuccinate lyase [Buchnera aphidicola (Anoecia oenotherae)]